jgi:hypothetical protein
MPCAVTVAGGRAFYQPGDSETIVTLGCTNAASLNEASCSGTNNLAVTASVIDFDTLPISVSSQTGSTLTVAVGQPASSDGLDYVLNSGDADVLTRTTISPPAWGGDVGVTIDSSACLQVTEDAPQTTSTLHCRPASADDRELDLLGIRVPAASLEEILTAAGLTDFPGDGLTLGIVLDESENPAAGVTISVDPGSTIEIINANRTGITPGNTTTASGMFISRDAPYGTFFGATKVTPFAPQLGGRVKNKLTIVLFQQSGIGN